MKFLRPLRAFFACFLIVITMCMSFNVAAAQKAVAVMENAYYRLTQNKELTIGYIGGSVTRGTGATDMNTKSWRALITSWFKSEFPDAQITEKCMAIGGTGSQYALYRMERALLDKSGDAPDIVFIETAINDVYDAVSGDNLKSYLESIVKKIYAKNPACDIVMVITGDINTMSESHETGIPFASEHHEIAKYYGIPVVDVGKALYDKMYQENGGNAEITSTSNAVWKKYVTDTVHPTDLGYEVYADTIKQFVTSEFAKITGTASYANKALPNQPKMSKLYLDARDADFSNFDFNTYNWFETGVYTNFGTDYHYLNSYKRGDSFTINFTGTELKLWTEQTNIVTRIKYSIDGGKEQTLSLSQPNSLSRIYTLAENLSAGEHSITITHNDSAEKVSIYDIFISGDSTMKAPVTFTKVRNANSPVEENQDGNCEDNKHRLGEWTRTASPTCASAGKEVRNCTVVGCMFIESRSIPALGHKHGAYSVTTPATCTEAGTKSAVCSVCGHKDNVKIKALGHSFGEWETLSEANCTNEGLERRVCQRCNIEEARYTELGNHNFKETVLLKAPTIYSTGLRKGRCLNCNEDISEEVPCSYKDNANGITFTAEVGVFAEGTDLKVNKIADKKISRLVKGDFEVYEITAVAGGNTVAPQGKFTVEISVTNAPENYKVYYVNDDNKPTELDTLINSEYKTISVETDKLGKLLIANGATVKDSAVKWVWIALPAIIVIIGLAVLLIVKNRK